MVVVRWPRRLWRQLWWTWFMSSLQMYSWSIPVQEWKLYLTNLDLWCLFSVRRQLWWSQLWSVFLTVNFLSFLIEFVLFPCRQTRVFPYSVQVSCSWRTRSSLYKRNESMWWHLRLSRKRGWTRLPWVSNICCNISSFWRSMQLQRFRVFDRKWTKYSKTGQEILYWE